MFNLEAPKYVAGYFIPIFYKRPASGGGLRNYGGQVERCRNRVFSFFISRFDAVSVMLTVVL